MMPGCTVTVRSAVFTSSTSAIFSTLSSRQPGTAFAPPLMPVRAPWGTTGTPWRDANRIVACTSSMVVARTRATAPSPGQKIASSCEYEPMTSASVTRAPAASAGRNSASMTAPRSAGGGGCEVSIAAG